jgi:hypothetical protein
MRPLAFAVLVLAGCEHVFDVSPIGDGSPISSGPCKMLAISDDFGGPTPCGNWGTTTGTGMVAETGGNLMLSGTRLLNDPTGCTAKTTIDFSGPIFVAVPTVTQPGDTYVVLNAQVADRTVMSPLIGYNYGYLGLIDLNLGNVNSSVPYVASKMLWWRLRPAPEGVWAEYSGDGHAWTALGLDPGTPPAQVTIAVAAGVNCPAYDPGTAVLQHLDVCPP